MAWLALLAHRWMWLGEWLVWLRDVLIRLRQCCAPLPVVIVAPGRPAVPRNTGERRFLAGWREQRGGPDGRCHSPSAHHLRVDLTYLRQVVSCAGSEHGRPRSSLSK